MRRRRAQRSDAVPPLTAADYPARPITLVVPYAAGGGNDVIARIVAEKMSASLGQTDRHRESRRRRRHHRDATGRQGRARRLHAPDRHQFARDQSVALSQRRLRSAQGFRADRTDRIEQQRGAGESRSVPAHSIAELIALAKAAGRQARPSPRPAPDRACIWPPNCSPAWPGVKLNHVPYKGSGPALNDLLGGHVAMMFCTMASAAGWCATAARCARSQ